MFDHIGLRVRDLDAALRFYTEALRPLGIAPGPRDESGTGFGRDGAMGFWLHPVAVPDAAASRGAHLAFAAPDRAGVDAFHAAGLRAGGRDNGAPGLRAEYGPTYYAAFLIDPDGNNVEAVCHAA